MEYNKTEEEILALLLSPGSYIKRHYSMNNKTCFRLIDKKGTPVMNITECKIFKLIQKGAIVQSGNKYLASAMFIHENQTAQ